jgi:hypothetical protein
MNGLRRHDLLLDDKLVQRIKKDEIVELEVSAGTHTLKGRIDWCTSNEFTFDVSENEIRYLKISGFKHSNWIMPILFIIILFHIFVLQPVFRRLHFEFLDNVFFGFIIMCGLFLVYLYTLGRKKYLWIRDDTQ